MNSKIFPKCRIALLRADGSLEALYLRAPMFAPGFVVLAREPLRDLETLVGPLAAENTVSAAPPPEIPDAVVEKVRTAVNAKELVTERVAGEKTVYAVNRSGRADSVVVLEIRFTAR